MCTLMAPPIHWYMTVIKGVVDHPSSCGCQSDYEYVFLPFMIQRKVRRICVQFSLRDAH